jgi:hypothetical protein
VSELALKLTKRQATIFAVLLSDADRPELAILNRLLMPAGGWKIPRKQKRGYLRKCLREREQREEVPLSRYADFWTDGDLQPENNQREPGWDDDPHFDFWSDGTDWVDCPEAIDNTDFHELFMQSLSPMGRLKFWLQMKHTWPGNPLVGDAVVEPCPRYDWFAYFEERERKKRESAERRRIPYQPKKERPIVRRVREGLEREFAWAIKRRKEQEEYWRKREDPDLSLKRALAPHLSTWNLRTQEIEERITTMSGSEWQQLLEFVPLATVPDYQRIRRELLAKDPGSDSKQS